MPDSNQHDKIAVPEIYLRATHTGYAWTFEGAPGGEFWDKKTDAEEKALEFAKQRHALATEVVSKNPKAPDALFHEGYTAALEGAGTSSNPYVVQAGGDYTDAEHWHRGLVAGIKDLKQTQASSVEEPEVEAYLILSSYSPNMRGVRLTLDTRMLNAYETAYPLIRQEAYKAALREKDTRIDKLRAALEHLLAWVESQTCTHEETHRGGMIWEICDDCGAKWADDRGGKPEFQWPSPVRMAQDVLTEKDDYE